MCVCRMGTYPRGLLCDVVLWVVDNNNKLWFPVSCMSSGVSVGWAMGGAAAT